VLRICANDLLGAARSLVLGRKKFHVVLTLSQGLLYGIDGLDQGWKPNLDVNLSKYHDLQSDST